LTLHIGVNLLFIEIPFHNNLSHHQLPSANTLFYLG
jgi:hypothetical protein